MSSASGETTTYDCAAAQRHMGAEPAAMTTALERHLASCADCRQFRADTMRLDTAIRNALEQVPPLATQREPNKIVRLPWRHRPGAVRRYALAASLLLAVALGALLWIGRSESVLAQDLVTHMAEESHSWDLQDDVPRSALALVVRQAGVRVADELRVTYAHSCWFRGRIVPHLVVQSSHGPVTVIILPHEPITTREHFSEGGYSGIIEPGAGGAYAVLARGDLDIAAALPEVARAITWR